MEDFLRQLQHIVPIAAIVLVAVGIVILAIYSAKAYLEDLAAVARDLGGEVAGNFLTGKYVKIFNADCEQRVAIISGSKDAPPYLVLRQIINLGFDLTLTKETAASRALQKIGLPIELKASDPEFDKKFLIKGSPEDRAVSFLASAERRQIIENFFEQEFSKLEVDVDKVSLFRPAYKEKELEAISLKPRLDQLRKLVAG